MVFYSYSHKDSRHRAKLQRHLSLLKREGLVREWFDGRIKPGEQWTEEISNNLVRAQLVLLLISSDFIESDYCWEKEMRAALHRHNAGSVRITPIIVRPVEDGWKSTVFGKLEALPRNARPVTKWPNRDEAWANVANGIREAISALKSRSRSSRRKAARTKSALE